MFKNLRGIYRRHHVKRIVGWAVIDSFVIVIGYLTAFSLRAATTPLDSILEPLLFEIFILIATISCLYASGVYYRHWRKASGQEIKIIFFGIAMATAIIVFVDLLFTERPLPISVILSANVFVFLGIVTTRYRSRLISGFSWRWKAVWRQEFPDQASDSVKRVLIVGAGESGIHVARRLQDYANGHGKHRIVGFIDDDPTKQGLVMLGCPILGTREIIPEIALQYKVDLIILAIHNIKGPDFREILTVCQDTGAIIKVAPNIIADFDSSRAVNLLRDVSDEDYLGRKSIEQHEHVNFDVLKNKVVLVTGAAGSIGSELCRQMMDYSPTLLLVLDTNESGIHDLYIDLIAKYGETARNKIIPLLVDVTRCSSIENVFATYQPQIIFHAAAYKHVPLLEKFPEEAVRVNIGGTLNVINLACDHNAERFVLVSTDKAVQPSSIMGFTKRVCECLVLSKASTSGKTLFAAVRFGNVLGSRGSVVPIFKRQIEVGGPVTITSREMTRYFMTIREAVNLMIHATCLTEGCDLYMLRMGEVVRIADLAEKMIRMRGLRPDKDIRIEEIGIRPGEKMHEELHEDHEKEMTTVHPGIVRLAFENNHHRFNGHYIEEVDVFLNTFQPTANLRSKLENLINHD